MTELAKIEQADTVRIGGIAVALSKAQAVMGRAKKDRKNPHFKSSYADLSSVMDACIGPLTENGIAVIQPTGKDADGEYAETILIHGESGQTLSCRVPLIIGKRDMQGYGSAVTYARRYGLMCMAGIAPDDDDGNAATASVREYNQEHKRAQEPSQDAIMSACTSLSSADDFDHLRIIWSGLPRDVRSVSRVITAKDARKAFLEGEQNNKPASSLIEGDEIPY